MSQILLAENAGYCFGVKRALKLAEDRLDQAAGCPVYSLGPLIHNPRAVHSLEEKGLQVITSLSEIRRGGGIVIIRAHGVPPEVKREAEVAGLKLVDATCPLVQKVQRLAHLLRDEGYQVVILGDEDHPEVKGVRAYGGTDSMILRKEEDLDRHQLWRKIGVVAQTTLPLQVFRAMTQAILERAGSGRQGSKGAKEQGSREAGESRIEGISSLLRPSAPPPLRSSAPPPQGFLLREIRIFNTLCPFTLARQREAQGLAGRADAILVVGGRNSANTTQLVELCRRLQPHTYPVEEAGEIEAHWLQGKEVIGITAGASTPPWTIKEVQIRVQGILSQKIFN